MRTLESRPRQDSRVSCVACARHMRPETVPWMQHSIGCPVRMAALSPDPKVVDSRGGQPLAAPVGTR